MATLQSYNGFSGQERNASWKIQKQLLDAGRIKDWRKMPCDICKQFDRNMMPHQENYFDVHAFFPMCIECHMKLHSRFSYPTEWIKHLFDVIHGWKPKLWGSVIHYFNNHKRVHHPSYKKIHPPALGAEWYYHLTLDQERANLIRSTLIQKSEQLTIFDPTKE